MKNLKERWRAKALVIDKPFTQGYKLYAHGDTEAKAIKALKKKAKGMNYMSSEIDCRKSL